MVISFDPLPASDESAAESRSSIAQRDQNSLKYYMFVF